MFGRNNVWRGYPRDRTSRRHGSRTLQSRRNGRNDFLYVSGQGPAGRDGKVSVDFAAQMRQTLENVRSVLVAGGLTMDHVVYAHVYLTDMANYERMNRLWVEAFPHSPPARAVLGVYKLPGEGLIEITAVAFKDLTRRSVIVPSGYPQGPASPGVIAGEKVYLSGFLGIDPAGKVPEDPRAQAEAAFDKIENDSRSGGAGLSTRRLCESLPNGKSHGRDEQDLCKSLRIRQYARACHHRGQQFAAGREYRVHRRRGTGSLQKARRSTQEHGPQPNREPVRLGRRYILLLGEVGFHSWTRPRHFCAYRGRSTSHDDAQSVGRPGGGRSTSRFSNVVATNVYLDEMNDFAGMNRVYAQYFSDIRPTRTTVALEAPPLPNRGPVKDDVYPTLEQISLIAVR